MTGSPYNTNFFRVEGPAGSFTGSTQLCADPALGDDPLALDDCIQNKRLRRPGQDRHADGVQVLRANYRDISDLSSGGYVDLWAKSATGQRLVVSGTGVSQTVMADAGTGEYFARIAVGSSLPNDIAVTNTSDAPDTVSHLKPAALGDKLHVVSATWDTADRTLRVVADSGSTGSTMSLLGYASDRVTVTPQSNGSKLFTVTNVPAPPSEVTVVSDKKGRDSDDVVVTGFEFESAQVVAAITAETSDISVGQTLTLDSIASQGTITAREWSISGGATLSSTTAQSTSFTPTDGGDFTVTLKVFGPGNSNTDTATFAVHVTGANTQPIANAGPDQLNVVPTSTRDAQRRGLDVHHGHTWTAPAGITLSATNTANPTFVMPVTGPTEYVFTLTATGTTGTTPSTDTVTITKKLDTIAVDLAQYKRAAPSGASAVPRTTARRTTRSPSSGTSPGARRSPSAPRRRPWTSGSAPGRSS